MSDNRFPRDVTAPGAFQQTGTTGGPEPVITGLKEMLHAGWLIEDLRFYAVDNMYHAAARNARICDKCVMKTSLADTPEDALVALVAKVEDQHDE